MSVNKRNNLSISDKYDIIVKIKSGVNRKQVLNDYNLMQLSHLTHILDKSIVSTNRCNQPNCKTKLVDYNDH